MGSGSGKLEGKVGLSSGSLRGGGGGGHLSFNGYPLPKGRAAQKR